MNYFKRNFMILVLFSLVLALPVWVQGVTLDRMGTCEPGYVCNSGAFQFLGTQWNKPVFSIDMKHQCSGVNLHEYVPGFGGGGVDFQILSIHGEYNYDTGVAKEKIVHQGVVIIDETLTCSKNPWAYGNNAGCGAPTIVNTVRVCTVPPPLTGPFPLSVGYMPNDLFMALQNWDKHKDDPDPLAGWDPYGTPGGSSALKITTPTSDAVIGEHAASFIFTLQNLPATPPGGTPKKVQMTWQRAQELPEWQGDIHVPPGTYDWFPFSGPFEALTTSFPLTVAVEPGFFASKPGHYRVQVKLSTETWWSSWRYFWIGQPTYDSKKILKSTAAMTAMKKNVMSTKMSKGSLKGLGAKGPVVASTKMQVVALKKAVVVVDGITYKPTPAIAGSPVDLFITFKNKGLADSSASLKYSVSCTVKSGGPACAVAGTTRAINKVIPAGQTYQITLAGATPAVAGTYEVTVKPEGGAVDSGKTITINVGLKIKPIKGAVAPINKK